MVRLPYLISSYSSNMINGIEIILLIIWESIVKRLDKIGPSVTTFINIYFIFGAFISEIGCACVYQVYLRYLESYNEEFKSE